MCLCLRYYKQSKKIKKYKQQIFNIKGAEWETEDNSFYFGYLCILNFKLLIFFNKSIANSVKIYPKRGMTLYNEVWAEETDLWVLFHNLFTSTHHHTHNPVSDAQSQNPYCA